MGRIVVGIDGTLASRHALEWAIEFARNSGDVVHVVHAQRTGYHRNEVGHLAISPGSRRDALDVVEEAVAQVAPKAAGVEVFTEVVTGRPGPVLVRAARGGRMIVIGECEAPLRSRCASADYVMKNSECPVVVVPLQTVATL